MMFISLTRYGSDRALRLSVSAIAFIDEVPGGSAVHILGGESLRVLQSPDEVEQLIEESYPTAVLVSGSFTDADREMVAGDIIPISDAEIAQAGSKRKAAR